MQANTGVRRIAATLAFTIIMLPVLAATRFTGGAMALPGNVVTPVLNPPFVPPPSTPNFHYRNPLGPNDPIPTRQEIVPERWLDGIPLGASYLEVMDKKYIFGDIVMDGNGGVPTHIGPSLEGIDEILGMFKFHDSSIDYTKLPDLTPPRQPTPPPPVPGVPAPLVPPVDDTAPPMLPDPDPPVINNPLVEKYIYQYDRSNEDNSLQWKTYVLFENGRVSGIAVRTIDNPTMALDKNGYTTTDSSSIVLSSSWFFKPPKERLWLQNDIGLNYQMAELATRRNFGWPDIPGDKTASIDTWYYLYYDKWNFALTIDTTSRLVIGVSIGDKLMAIPKSELKKADATTTTDPGAAPGGPAPVPPAGAPIGGGPEVPPNR